LGLQVLRQQIAESSTRRPPLFLSSASFTETDLDNFLIFLDSDRFQPTTVRELRASALVAPPRMSEALVKALDAQEISEPWRPGMPAWALAVIARREYFQQVAFCASRGEEDEYWLFNFAMQTPAYLSLTKLQPLDWPFPASSSDGDAMSDGVHWYPHVFEIVPGANESAFALLQIPAEEIFILEQVVQVGDSCCVSDMAEEPLLPFLASLPEQKRAASQVREVASGSQNRTSSSSIVQELPWTEHLLSKQQRTRALGPDSSSESDSSDTQSELEDDLPEFGGKQAWEELQQVRERMVDLPEKRAGDFVVSVLGGVWTAKHRGVAADAVQGRAKGQAVISWCHKAKVLQSARFEISAYTEASAGILARAWCSKMQHFWNLSMQSPEQPTAFSAEDKRSLLEPSDFTLLAQDPTSSKQMQKRIQAIRALFA